MSAMPVAESLSIEPFERSRWRLRRTRVLSYVFSIVRSTVCGRTRRCWHADQDGHGARAVGERRAGRYRHQGSGRSRRRRV